MTELTAYMCCQRADGIEVETPESNGLYSGISIDEENITVNMVPASLPSGCSVDLGGKITAMMHTSGGYFYTCRMEMDSYLSIAYPYPGLRDYPEITATNHEHCQWIETQVSVDGPDRCNQLQYGCLWVYTQCTSGGGAISDNKEDAFPQGGSSNTHQLTNNYIVPGMRVLLYHLFHNYYDSIIQLLSTFQYYVTPEITGGQIVSINGDHEDVGHTYNVSVEGTVIECRPSDWIEWNIDDFVFISSVSTPPVIVPFKIGVDGA